MDFNRQRWVSKPGKLPARSRRHGVMSWGNSKSVRSSLDFCETRLTPEDVAGFNRLGFLRLPLIGAKSINLLKLEAERLWGSAHKEYDQNGSWLSNALLIGVQDQSELFCDLLYLSPLVDAMMQLIGPNIKLASNQLTFKHPGDSHSYHWHQDNGYGPLLPETAVSCWLALDDVNQFNGCLWIIPGSHTRGNLTHLGGKSRERLAVVSDEERAVPIPLAAGECVLFHGLTLHMSKGNSTTKMRRAFFFRYADADAIEFETGKPRIGKLLRGKSKFPEVNECSKLVCHPRVVETAPE